jgi:hypothetical protein
MRQIKTASLHIQYISEDAYGFEILGLIERPTIPTQIPSRLNCALFYKSIWMSMDSNNETSLLSVSCTWRIHKLSIFHIKFVRLIQYLIDINSSTDVMNGLVL